jgi:hypothetical protein
MSSILGRGGEGGMHTEFLEGNLLGNYPLGRVRRSDDRITVKFMERGCWVMEGPVTTQGM